MTTDTKSELAAILTGAAIFPLDDRAFLRITGSDATRWLNGMVTNSIQALAPGEGKYNFLLNAQGRIQGDCTIYRDSDPNAAEFVLETDRSQVAAIQQHLDRFIIMDDVELIPIMDDQHGLLVAGPSASEHLAALLLPAPTPFYMGRVMHNGQPLLILGPYPPFIPRYEVWGSPETIAALLIALEGSAVTPVSAQAVEAYRVLSGTPRFGTDIRDKDLPQETNQTHALHFSKGCYLGQEIVERIRSRGQVHRTFSGFRLTALPATLPAPLTSDGKPAGELTSAATIGEETFALGYVRREALDRNQPLAYEGGTATPTALPLRMTTS
jgi:folate-binding protein YgfZ